MASIKKKKKMRSWLDKGFLALSGNKNLSILVYIMTTGA